MIPRRSSSLIALLALLSLGRAQAQTGTFSVSVDRNKVAAGEQFQASFTVEGSDVNGARNFKAPNFGQILVLNGPNTSQSFQFINGRTSGSVTYSYVLYARQPGKYTIGPASIEYGGKTLTSQPVMIEVVQGRPQAQSQSGAVRPEAGAVGDNLFIKAGADKQRVRLGEQLVITYKLYTRVSVSGYDLSKAPTFEGFWSEDFDLPKQPALANEVINGKQYRVAIIKKTALFATQAGNLKIAPIEVRCAVQMQNRRRSNDPFDTFFNDPFFQSVQTVNYDFTSNALTITVDPIPSGAPASYSGAIGRYMFSASVDKNEVKAGDPVTLRLTVAGIGNVKLIAVPKPTLPSDIESYEPKISEEISRDGGVIKGKKTAEYLLIPRNPGQRSVETIPFSYYDLEKKEYITLRSPKFDLTILPGRNLESGAAVVSKEDVRLLGEDIRFLKLSIGNVQRPDETPLSSFWFFAGLVLPPLASVGTWVYRRRRERLYGDVPRFLFEKAGREATKRLKKARALLSKGDTQSYHTELSKALREYLEHKLRRPKATLTIEEAVERLRQGGVREEALRKLRLCDERAEYARFAPASDTRAAREDLLDDASEVINVVERELNT